MGLSMPPKPPAGAATAEQAKPVPNTPPLTATEAADLDKRFTYHPPKCDQPYRYSELRCKAKEFAALVVSLTPKSREQALALTHIEVAAMWANAAIARNE